MPLGRSIRNRRLPSAWVAFLLASCGSDFHLLVQARHRSFDDDNDEVRLSKMEVYERLYHGISTKARPEPVDESEGDEDDTIERGYGVGRQHPSREGVMQDNSLFLASTAADENNSRDGDEQRGDEDDEEDQRNRRIVNGVDVSQLVRVLDEQAAKIQALEKELARLKALSTYRTVANDDDDDDDDDGKFVYVKGDVPREGQLLPSAATIHSMERVIEVQTKKIEDQGVQLQAKERAWSTALWATRAKLEETTGKLHECLVGRSGEDGATAAAASSRAVTEEPNLDYTRDGSQRHQRFSSSPPPAPHEELPDHSSAKSPPSPRVHKTEEVRRLERQTLRVEERQQERKQGRRRLRATSEHEDNKPTAYRSRSDSGSAEGGGGGGQHMESSSGGGNGDSDGDAGNPEVLESFLPGSRRAADNDFTREGPSLPPAAAAITSSNGKADKQKPRRKYLRPSNGSDGNGDSDGDSGNPEVLERFLPGLRRAADNDFTREGPSLPPAAAAITSSNGKADKQKPRRKYLRPSNGSDGNGDSDGDSGSPEVLESFLPGLRRAADNDFTREGPSLPPPAAAITSSNGKADKQKLRRTYLRPSNGSD